MHLRTYLATTRRILTQLRADRRTVGLIAIVPAALLTLLYFVYRDYPGADLLFNHIAVSMMAILPTTVMFLVTSVAMLRERVSGTLERLWTTFHALAERGATLLVSSHVMDEAFRCDQVLLMRQGRILSTTTATDLLDSTGADTVDAAFLTVIAGSENRPEQKGRQR